MSETPVRSAITLLGILQKHGLSTVLLEKLAQQCERHEDGGVQLFISKGRFTSYDLRQSGKLTALDAPEADQGSGQNHVKMHDKAESLLL
jgi:hypothetical protein